MSDLGRDVVPPYLPDLIGDGEIAEAALMRKGRTVLVRYRPAIMLRAERAQLVSEEARWEWIRAMLVEVIDGRTRYGGSDGVEVLSAPLKLLVRDIFDDLGAHAAQWAVAWIEAHQQAVGRTQQDDERQRGFR